MKTTEHVRYPHDALIGADGKRIKTANDFVETKSLFEERNDRLIEQARLFGWEDGYREGKKSMAQSYEHAVWVCFILGAAVILLIFLMVTQ